MTKSKGKPAKVESDEVGFWRGDFGDAYTERNAGATLRSRTALWAQILDCMAGAPPKSILEIGANIGDNLRALRALTAAEFYATEPNDRARRRLIDDGVVAAGNVRDSAAAAMDFPDAAADLVFTSGVLIHIAPEDLAASCKEIHRVARRYVVSIEYFSPHPEEVLYRGRKARLFKRDFGAYWLDSFAGLRVLGCGFAWQRLTGLDNLTWWVLEKRQ